MHCTPHLLLLSQRQEELRRGRREECFCNWSGRQWRLNGVIPPAYEILQRLESLLQRPRESSVVQGALTFLQPAISHSSQQEPMVPCLLLELVKFRRGAPLRGLQPLRYDASSVRRQRRGRGLLIRSWELPADSLPCPTPPTHAAHSGLQNDTPPTTGVCVLWESTSGKQYTCLQTITQIQWGPVLKVWRGCVVLPIYLQVQDRYEAQ